MLLYLLLDKKTVITKTQEISAFAEIIVPHQNRQMLAANAPTALVVRGNPGSLSNHHRQSIVSL